MMKKTNKSDFISDFIYNENIDKDISIYIHIPFCESKCYYCDFVSYSTSNIQKNVYFECLYKEISLYKNFLKDKNIVSIFIGGGTPSSVDSKYIYKTLSEIYKISNIDTNCEITIETNPNSLTQNKLKIYLSTGINRFSIGAQSFNDEILKTIGRVHNKKDILNACDLVKKNNIENFNIDLMLALPNQDFNDIRYSIDFIKSINPSHVSYYSLILEEGTKLFFDNKKNKLQFPNEEIDREMYHYISSSLSNLGYKQYEISNFSKNEFECKHNLRYWKLKNYLGIGLASHSNIKNLRFSNHLVLKNYENAIKNNYLPIYDYELLDVKSRINEFVIMRLRLNEGINIEFFNSIFNINFMNYYKKEILKNQNLGLIKISNNSLFLTEKGRDLSNLVELDFIRL